MFVVTVDFMNIETRNTVFPKFLNQLAKDLNKFYREKVGLNYKTKNKGNTGKFNPVTTFDKAFEKLIRKKLAKNSLIIKLLEKNLKQKIKKAISPGLLIQ